MVKPVRVVTELGQHPGAEDDAKSRQTPVDLGVRVSFKLCESSPSSSTNSRFRLPTTATVLLTTTP
jgi:hypothetical protein